MKTYTQYLRVAIRDYRYIQNRFLYQNHQNGRNVIPPLTTIVQLMLFGPEHINQGVRFLHHHDFGLSVNKLKDRFHHN